MSPGLCSTSGEPRVRVHRSHPNASGSQDEWVAVPSLIQSPLTTAVVAAAEGMPGRRKLAPFVIRFDYVFALRHFGRLQWATGRSRSPQIMHHWRTGRSARRSERCNDVAGLYSIIHLSTLGFFRVLPTLPAPLGCLFQREMLSSVCRMCAEYVTSG